MVEQTMRIRANSMLVFDRRARSLTGSAPRFMGGSSVDAAGISQELTKLSFARFTFRLRARSAWQLQAFKGPALRGGLGHALRETFCKGGDGKECHCPPERNCAYRYLFAPASGGRGGKTTSPPFVTDVPLTPDQHFEAGDFLDFGVTLIGRAIPYQECLVDALEHMGRTRGLGWRGLDSGKFSLDAVWQRRYRESPTLLHPLSTTGQRGAIAAESIADIPFPQSLPPDSTVVGVRFVTPTHLRHKAMGEAKQSDITVPHFHRLIRSLLFRFTELDKTHGNSTLSVDFPQLLAAAREVELLADETRWCSFERFSSQQGERIPVKGFVGTAWYAGELAPFLPLLMLGEVVHTGKGLVLGQGQFRIVDAHQNMDADDFTALYEMTNATPNARRGRRE